MSKQAFWIDVDDGLPDFGEPVFVHSHDAEWQPGIAWRVQLPGNGWKWTHDRDDDELGGLQFWARVPRLPNKLRHLRDAENEA